MTDAEYMAKAITPLVEGPATNAKLKQAVVDLMRRLSERSEECSALRSRNVILSGFAPEWLRSTAAPEGTPP